MHDVSVILSYTTSNVKAIDQYLNQPFAPRVWIRLLLNLMGYEVIIRMPDVALVRYSNMISVLGLTCLYIGFQYDEPTFSASSSTGLTMQTRLSYRPLYLSVSPKHSIKASFTQLFLSCLKTLISILPPTPSNHRLPCTSQPPRFVSPRVCHSIIIRPISQTASLYATAHLNT